MGRMWPRVFKLPSWWGWLCLVAIGVLLTRLPFLDAGYGLHWDAWGNASIAQEMAATHSYRMARVPGAPVYEILIALLAAGGPLALNGLSVVAGIACVILMAAIARRMGCRDWLLAAVALGGCPVFFISSVTTKDFTLACAFVLLSTWFVGKRQPIRAGIALGLAMACRLSSGAMALPLGFMLVAHWPPWERSRPLFQFALATTLTVTAAFIPAFSRYGLSFLTTYTPIYYPDWSVVAWRGSVEVWGIIGCVGLAAAILGALVFRRAPTSIASPISRPDLVAALSVVLIYGALYLAYPDQAGYFLPAVPFVILLLARFSPRWLFQAFCIVTAASSFIDWNGGKFTSGAAFRDRAQRLGTMANVRNFYSYARTLPGKNVFVIGAFYHGIGLIAPESKQGHFVYLLTANELNNFIRDGFTIYYLPAIREFERDVNGVDLAKYGAINLVEFRESQRLSNRDLK
jgi:MFS family permease